MPLFSAPPHTIDYKQKVNNIKNVQIIKQKLHEITRISFFVIHIIKQNLCMRFCECSIKSWTKQKTCLLFSFNCFYYYFFLNQINAFLLSISNSMNILGKKTEHLCFFVWKKKCNSKTLHIHPEKFFVPCKRYFRQSNFSFLENKIFVC